MTVNATGEWTYDSTTGDNRWTYDNDPEDYQWTLDDATGDYRYGVSGGPVLFPVTAVVYTADTSVRYINSVPQHSSTAGLADVALVLVDEAPPGPTVPTSPDWVMAHSLVPILGDTRQYRGEDGLGNPLTVPYTSGRYYGQPTGWIAADFAAVGSVSEAFQPYRVNDAQTDYEPDPDGTPYTWTWQVVATPPVTAAFDPSAYTVAEVVDYADIHPDEVQAIYDAEEAGKGRATLLAALEERGAT